MHTPYSDVQTMYKHTVSIMTEIVQHSLADTSNTSSCIPIQSVLHKRIVSGQLSKIDLQLYRYTMYSNVFLIGNLLFYTGYDERH